MTVRDAGQRKGKEKEVVVEGVREEEGGDVTVGRCRSEEEEGKGRGGCEGRRGLGMWL